MNFRKTLFLALLSLQASALPVFLGASGGKLSPQAARPRPAPGIEHLQLKITVGTQTVVAPLVDSETTRDFLKLLPLTLRLSDLGNREKYGALPTKLSAAGTVQTTYQAGDLAYWLGGGIAAFYHQDGHEVKAGLIVLAKLPAGTTLFTAPGALTARFETVEKP